MPTLAQRWIDEGKQYGRQEGWQKGHQEGLQEGRQEEWWKGWLEGFLEGWCQTELRIARNMLLRDYSIEEVAVITGLKEEKIKRLINQ